MNLIAPIIFLIASVGMFFGYVDPNYKGRADFVESDYKTYGVKQLRLESEQYNNTAKNSNEVTKTRDSLISKKASISNEDQDRLSKLLPDNVDNVKLILEISNIAEKRSLSIRNIALENDSNKSNKDNTIIGPDNSLYGTVSLKFSVISSYESFLDFLNDIENNLRLVDVTDISFTATEGNFYEFTFNIVTYWLK